MLVTGDYWPAALGDTINVGTSRRSCAVRPLSFETMTRFGPGSCEVPCMVTTLRQSRAAEGNPLEDIVDRNPGAFRNFHYSALL
jgi:hypothetical protein